MKKSLYLSLLFGALLVPTLAQTPDVSPEMKKDICRLLELTNAVTSGKQTGILLFEQMTKVLQANKPDLPPRFFEILKEELLNTFAEKDRELMDLIIPIYSRHFTHDDIKALIAFYETPTGRKASKALPEIMNEAVKAGESWAQKIMPGLLERFRSRLSREGIEF